MLNDTLPQCLIFSLSDQSYKTSLDNLEHLRQQWEREMTALCQSFQHLEEERINNLRNEMWAHSNIVSTTATCVDQVSLHDFYENIQVEMGFQMWQLSVLNIPVMISVKSHWYPENRLMINLSMANISFCEVL